MARSSKPEKPIPAGLVRRADAAHELTHAAAWAACANMATAGTIAPPPVLALASRYLRDHEDTSDELAMAAALDSMTAAVKKYVVDPLDSPGHRFTVLAVSSWRCTVSADGRIARQPVHVTELPRTPEADLQALISAAGSVFPFRRCPVCNAFFARTGRQVYCTPRCTERAELKQRSSSDSYKKKHRERMRRLRSEQLKHDKGARPNTRSEDPR